MNVDLNYINNKHINLNALLLGFLHYDNMTLYMYKVHIYVFYIYILIRALIPVKANQNNCFIFLAGTMALVSTDTKIAELLNELHQLIKQTQVSTALMFDNDLFCILYHHPVFIYFLYLLNTQEERSRSEHNLLNIQKTHERMQTENKSKTWIPFALFAMRISHFNSE